MNNPEIAGKDKLIKAAKNLQQNFYELLSDWNSYDQKKPHYLKNFIGIALFGPPKIDQLPADTSFLSESYLTDEIFFHDPDQQMKIHKIYEKIVQHGTQNTTKKEIMCGLIYNVTFDTSIECGKYFGDEHVSKCLQPIPIFKVLKNVIKKNESGKAITTKIMIYYVDDCERVYKNWNDYLNNNVLPVCIMVVPKGGEYQGDYKNQWSDRMSYVSVEIYKSPASKVKTIKTIDSINKLVSLGCAGIGVAAALNPVGATVMALSAVGMGLSGLWSIGRSSQKIADRHKHEQSIGIKNKDGLIRWFGVASSILTVASSGSSMLLSSAIQNGTSLSTAAKIASSSVQIGSIASTGVGAGLMINKMYESRCKRYVSAQDVLNLVSNLLLFSNSAVDLKLAKSIIKKDETELIQDFELGLRNNRHRKEFFKMVQNSTSIPSNQSSQEQIIRSTVKISSMDLLSSSIANNEMSFLLKGIEVSSSDGLITINGKCLMRPLDFAKKLKEKEKKGHPIAIALTTTVSLSDGIFDKVLKNFLARYRKEFKFSQLSLSQFSSFLNSVCEVDKPDVIFGKLLLIGIKLVRKINKDNYPANNILAETVDFLWEFIQMNLRDKIGPCRQYYREFIMKIIIGMYSSVESNTNEWIDSFKYYMLIKSKHLQRKITRNNEGKLYLLQVM